MKKLLIATVLGMAAMVTTPVIAAPAVCPQGSYQVVSGDNLSDLSSNEWQKLEQMNMPELSGRRRKMGNGKTNVLIFPGECLKGVHKVNGTLVLSDGNVDGTTTSWDFKSFAAENWGKGLIGLIILVLLGILAFVLYLLSNLRRNPITSGPPQRAGGESLGQVQQRYAQLGEAHGIQVVSVTPGFGNGVMNVAYGDRTKPTWRPRELENQPMFEVQRRDRNGRPMPPCYTLQACGNDVRSGLATIVTGAGFRFSTQPEERQVPVPAPVVAETSTPTPAPLPEAANEATPEPAPAARDRDTIFTIVGEHEGRPPMMTFNVNKVTVELKENGTATVRFIQPVAAMQEASASDAA